MKYSEYYITDREGKSNCIIRSCCKLFNKEYEDVYNELMAIAKELGYDFYAEIEVFEKYLEQNKMVKLDYKDMKIKDLKLDNGEYAVFCFDKKDFYHMVAIIDNTLYDRTPESFDLYVITVYKKV